MALSDSIDRNTPAKVPERCSEAPSVAGVERILALAHRLSYTSFAPPGAFLNLHMISATPGHPAPAGTHEWQAASMHCALEALHFKWPSIDHCKVVLLAGFVPGVTPLGVFRPPAPQDGQMQAAQLHQFAGECWHCTCCNLPTPAISGHRCQGLELNCTANPNNAVLCLQLNTSRLSFGGRGNCHRQWRSSPPCLPLLSSHLRCSPVYPACRQVWMHP